MRSGSALDDLAKRAVYVMSGLRSGHVDYYGAKLIISEMADVILEMADRIAFLEKKASEEGRVDKGALAADVLALQDENHVLKLRIRELSESVPKQRPTHHAVDNLGSSSSLEAMVGCGASYRGKTQIGVGSYRAKMHGVNS